jgi:hypothetical protein
MMSSALNLSLAPGLQLFARKRGGTVTPPTDPVTITEGITFVNTRVISASLYQIRFSPADPSFGALDFTKTKAGGYAALGSIGVN